MAKWLIPTDGSPRAVAAATWAAHFSVQVQGGVELTLMAVMENALASIAAAGVELAPLQPHVVEALDQQAQQAMQEALERTRAAAAAQGEGIAIVLRLEMGNPGQRICQVAKEGGFDLIVIGSRGLTGLSEVLLGSVSNYVVHHAAVPVLVHHLR